MSAENLAEKLKFQLQSAEKDVQTSKEVGEVADFVLIDVRDQIASDLQVVEDYIVVSKRLKTY